MGSSSFLILKKFLPYCRSPLTKRFCDKKETSERDVKTKTKTGCQQSKDICNQQKATTEKSELRNISQDAGFQRHSWDLLAGQGSPWPAGNHKQRRAFREKQSELRRPPGTTSCRKVQTTNSPRCNKPTRGSRCLRRSVSGRYGPLPIP